MRRRSRPEFPGPVPVRRTNLTTLILDQLRQYVIAHNLSENDRLPPERDLAIQLGVSRPSLRNALDWLSQRQALRRVQGGGTFLQPTFLEIVADHRDASALPEIAEIVEARLLLEPQIARLVAERITTTDLERLKGELAAAEKRLDCPHVWRQYDLKFHVQLGQLARNGVLASAIESLFTHVLPIWTAHHEQADLRQSAADHQALLEAFARRDGDAADRRMRTHVEAFGHRVGYALVKIGA